MESSRPQPIEYAPFYETYISRVSGTGVWPMLQGQTADVERLFGSVGPADESFRYAPNKWTFRDVAGHLIDGERIFGARAFCFSRGEQAPLPSFDENVYVEAGRYGGVPLRELVAEFAAVRAANLLFLSRLEEERWMQVGTASSRPISVRAIAYILAGHVQHHLAIVEERYLPALRG
jgi:hypothetical protein